MISYLKGVLVAKNLTSTGAKAVVEVNNIGYDVNINKKTYMSLPDIASEICIYTSLIHKEDGMSLCGFLSAQEKETFGVLQTVSGVGTKVALQILELPINDIISAVISEDTKAQSTVPTDNTSIVKTVFLLAFTTFNFFSGYRFTKISERFLTDIS